MKAFYFVFQGRVDTNVVMACFDAFGKTVTKPTWVILDKALQHTLALFNAKRWEPRGLFIKYLPAYLPELNLIEILWRFTKYDWLPL